MRGGGTSGPRALCARGISVAFGGIRVLRDVTVEVAPGAITGLIGPNGAGKTTLINVISGFQEPASGSIFLGDEKLTGLPAHQVARRGVVRSFQGGRLFSKMTVFENVFVAALSRTAERKDAHADAMILLSHFGLEHRVGRFADEIPYGEERLLAIARSLAAKPNILLLDEPAAGLNEAETLALKKALLAIPSAFGCGVLIIEHDMDLIMSICSRVWVMANGANLAVGTPLEVSKDARVIGEYLGGATDVA